VAQARIPPRLRHSFTSATATGGAPQPAIDATFDDLVARYREPHRHYHDVEHVDEVVAIVEGLGGDAAVVLAAFFHDAVYDPRSSSNEAESAALARDALAGLGIDDAVITEIVRLIEATADYSVVASDPRLSVLADADLAILGAPPDRYARYAEGVRREYGFVDDDGWKAGRAAVLEALLARPRLYVNATELESSARANLAAELARLASP
jgi:predicted metal-dependent HD superfamily phosphohydrolase